MVYWVRFLREDAEPVRFVYTEAVSPKTFDPVLLSVVDYRETQEVLMALEFVAKARARAVLYSGKYEVTNMEALAALPERRGLVVLSTAALEPVGSLDGHDLVAEPAFLEAVVLGPTEAAAILAAVSRPVKYPVDFFFWSGHDLPLFAGPPDVLRRAVESAAPTNYLRGARPFVSACSSLGLRVGFLFMVLSSILILLLALPPRIETLLSLAAGSIFWCIEDLTD